MGIDKNEINNNISKLSLNVAFSVSERGLPYLKFKPLYTIPHFFS